MPKCTQIVEPAPAGIPQYPRLGCMVRRPRTNRSPPAFLTVSTEPQTTFGFSSVNSKHSRLPSREVYGRRRMVRVSQASTSRYTQKMKSEARGLFALRLAIEHTTVVDPASPAPSHPGLRIYDKRLLLVSATTSNHAKSSSAAEVRGPTHS